MQTLQTAVVGGGIMGACTCLVLAEQGHQVYWYAPEEPPRRSDGAQARAYALSPETVRLLESLGVWNRVAEKAKAVSAMEVYPRATEIGVACLKAEDVPSDYLAQILGHAELLAACEDHVRGIARITRDPRFPTDIRVGTHEAPAQLLFAGPLDKSAPSGGQEALFFDLVVAADGAGSFLRRRSGILWGRRDYAQTALVMAFESATPHGGVACQWFGEDRILALLPLVHDRQLSMVYSLPNTEADEWLASGPQEIARRVTTDSGHRWGDLSALSLPVTSPLAMTLVERTTLGRLLLLGDAAHTVHPLAGYGLNLGMQDLHALRQTLRGLPADSTEWGLAGRPLTAGAVPKQLQLLARQRAWAVRRVQWGLDSLWRTMRLEGPGMPLARQIGIHCIDALPTLRRWLIAQALGRGTP
jgi:2-octaprenyl-3-methyl-6-methoxy-1,4-benzoquinol hydroxylase/2-octaprenylphenol hydroxylase